jgi:hypothetical protein
MRNPKYLVLLRPAMGSDRETRMDQKLAPRDTIRDAKRLAEKPPAGWRVSETFQYNPSSGIYDVVEG